MVQATLTNDSCSRILERSRDEPVQLQAHAQEVAMPAAAWPLPGPRIGGPNSILRTKPSWSSAFLFYEDYNLHLGPEVADGGNQRRVRRDVLGSSLL